MHNKSIIFSYAMYEAIKILKENLQKERGRKILWLQLYKEENVTIQVLQTVFKVSGLNSILLNKHIISGFRTRLYIILKSVSAAAQYGSTTLCTLLLMWRSDPKTQYQIKIYYSEVEIISLKNENDALIERKWKLETELENETAKRRKTEKAYLVRKKCLEKQKCS